MLTNHHRGITRQDFIQNSLSITPIFFLKKQPFLKQCQAKIDVYEEMLAWFQSLQTVPSCWQWIFLPLLPEINYCPEVIRCLNFSYNYQ